MKADTCECCQRPRHNLVLSHWIAFGGPALRHWEQLTGKFCPRCRALHRSTLRTDRPWTDEEATELERIAWDECGLD